MLVKGAPGGDFGARLIVPVEYVTEYTTDESCKYIVDHSRNE